MEPLTIVYPKGMFWCKNKKKTRNYFTCLEIVLLCTCIFMGKVDFQNPGHMLLPTFPSFRPMGMVGEACLPSNAYYPRTPDYTLCSGVHVCWSEHSDSSFIYGFMSLDYGLVTITTTTYFTWLELVQLYICIFMDKVKKTNKK